jgi:single-stranded DNA-binding protein
MTASALVSGRIFHAPESRVSKAGKPSVVAKLREGAGDAVVWRNVVAFAEDAREELKGLGDGDGVAVSGPFSVTTYERNGENRLNHSIVAERAISARRVKKRERAPAWEGAR